MFVSLEKTGRLAPAVDILQAARPPRIGQKGRKHPTNGHLKCQINNPR
jgi:hypothetical protein